MLEPEQSNIIEDGLRAHSSSSHSAAASDRFNHDKIIDQCIVGGTAGLSCVKIHSSLALGQPTNTSSLFGKVSRSLEKLFVSEIVDYIVVVLNSIPNKVIANFGSKIIYLLIIWLFQVCAFSVRAYPNEVCVSEIIERSSISKSKIDIAFLSPDSRLLLNLIEVKTFEGTWENQETQDAIKQTICYSIVPLAYSVWGVLQMKIELVSLLICRSCVYRLTFNKSEKPFGLDLKIERAVDTKMMHSILDEYVFQFKKLFCELRAKGTPEFATPDPRDWTPVNFNFEEGIAEKFSSSTEHSLGFLFRSKARTIQKFTELYKCDLVTCCSSYPAGDEDLLIKIHSVVLDLGYEESAVNVKRIIDFHANEISSAENDARVLANVLANIMKSLGLNAEQAKKVLQGQTSTPVAELATDTSTAHDPMVGETSDLVPSMNETSRIKHPYIGVVTFGSIHSLNTILLMFDMGPTLAKVIRDESFKAKWSGDAYLRSAFFIDVGQSALNLVVRLGLCHNDIRPSNIAVKGDRFCLIDFDNCRGVPSFRSSPVLKGLTDKKEGNMMMSVAQIALVVFKVEFVGCPVKVIWNKWIRGESKVLSSKESVHNTVFENWVSKKLLQDVFTSSRAAELNCDENFMVNRLRRTLGLPILAP
jgi:hypothetical protein